MKAASIHDETSRWRIIFENDYLSYRIQELQFCVPWARFSFRSGTFCWYKTVGKCIKNKKQNKKKRLILLILCGWNLEKEGWKQLRTMFKLIIWSLHSQRKVLQIFKSRKISGLSHGLILLISLKRFKPYKPLLWLRLQETFSFTSNLRPLKFGSNEIIVIICKKVDFTKHRQCYSKKLKYLFLTHIC